MARALHFVIGQGIEPCLSLWACFHVYQEDYIRLWSLNCPCLFPATLPHVFVVYEHFGYILSNFFVHSSTCHFTDHGHIFRVVEHPFSFPRKPIAWFKCKCVKLGHQCFETQTSLCSRNMPCGFEIVFHPCKIFKRIKNVTIPDSAKMNFSIVLSQ